MTRIATVCITLLLFFSAQTRAQNYPVKPIRVVVPFAAGGAVDTVARALSQKLTEIWKQQIIVDNRPGAGGNIAADVVAKSAPDGYNMFITTHGFAISPGLYRKLPYDPVKDFIPVTQLTSSYLILVTNPKMRASSFSELVALAKLKPGSLNYGSTGIGAPPHVVMELLKNVTGIDMVHVPYKGDALLNPALLSGEVQAALLPLAGALQHVKAGRLHAIAMTGRTRSAAIPEVPTIAEAGVPGFEHIGWLGIFAPAGTPREIVDQFRAEIAKAVHSPEMKERWPAWGYEPVGGTPEQFAAIFKTDLATYARAIREAKIPPQD